MRSFSIGGNQTKTYQRRESFSIIFAFRKACNKMDIVTFDTWGGMMWIDHKFQTTSSEVEYSMSWDSGNFGTIIINNKMTGFAFNILIIDVPYSY